MDSPSSSAVVRLDLFFPPLAGSAAAALPSLRDVQAGNRCLVVGPRGSAKSSLLLNYCCRAALAEADPRRRRALLVASRAHLEREPLPPAPRPTPTPTPADNTTTTTTTDPSSLVDLKYVEDVQGLKAVGAALHTYRPPGEGYACVAVLGLSELLRQGVGASDAAATPDAGGGRGRGGGGGFGAAGAGGGRTSRDREVTRALALLSDAADSQRCALVVADDAVSGGGGAAGATTTSPVAAGGGGFGGGGYESPAPGPPSSSSGTGAAAPAAGYWAQRWFPVTLSLSEEGEGEFVMRAVGGGGGGGAGGAAGGGRATTPGGGGATTTTTTTLPPELARARVRYAVAPSGEAVVTDVQA